MGWPVYRGQQAVATPPVNPTADDASAGYLAGNGYTNVEERLHALSAALEGGETLTARNASR